jgi:hypothetical protein
VPVNPAANAAANAPTNLEANAPANDPANATDNVVNNAANAANIQANFALNPRHSAGLVDGVYSYQTSYGFASEQIPRCSQGTLLPSSGEPKVSNPWNNVQRKDSI